MRAVPLDRYVKAVCTSGQKGAGSFTSVPLVALLMHGIPGMGCACLLTLGIKS